MLIDSTRRLQLWNQTVDRRLVHRDAVAEVLLTHVAADGGDRFTIGAQWPRGHRVYRPDTQGRADPMLLLETVRQAGLAVSHLGFDVQQQWHSLMLDVGFDLLGPEPVRIADIAIILECQDIRRRGGNLSSMTVALTFYNGDSLFATGSGSIRWLPGESYHAFRMRSALPTAPPAGQAEAFPTQDRARADSLLAACDGDPLVRRLVVPLGHPVYFDHLLDHVPGMVLVDAAWQAAREVLPDDARLRRCRMRCPSFTELDRQTEVRIDPIGTGLVHFEIVQGERRTAMGTLDVRG